MKMNAPKNITWTIAVVIGLLALIGNYVAVIPFVTANAFILVTVAFVLLALGCLLKGL